MTIRTEEWEAGVKKRMVLLGEGYIYRAFYPYEGELYGLDKEILPRTHLIFKDRVRLWVEIIGWENPGNPGKSGN